MAAQGLRDSFLRDRKWKSPCRGNWPTITSARMYQDKPVAEPTRGGETDSLSGGEEYQRIYGRLLLATRGYRNRCITLQGREVDIKKKKILRWVLPYQLAFIMK